jgi:uncharacterized membrane-anchored protein YjiN (DUF445 family)
MKIASKLIDQDICLSIMDKIALRNPKKLRDEGRSESVSNVIQDTTPMEQGQSATEITSTAVRNQAPGKVSVNNDERITLSKDMDTRKRKEFSRFYHGLDLKIMEK